MTKPAQNLLLIFVKTPVAGKVKTRLAASIGDRKALDVYKRLLTYTKKIVLETGSGIHKQVWYSGTTPSGEMWPDGRFQLKKQSEGDLGKRMTTAFKAGFNEGYEKIVIIGSDCDRLRAEHIRQAYRQLHDHEVVLGPSRDGGYYLLGLNRWLPILFENKPWSTPDLYRETLETIRRHHLSFTELETLNDIDTLDDLKRSSIDTEILDG